MNKPVNLQVSIADGIANLEWECPKAPMSGYEIQHSYNGGAFEIFGSTMGTRFSGAVVGGGTHKFRVRGKDYTSKFGGKYIYPEEYEITPLFEPGGPSLHLEAQRGNMMFASKEGYLMWSNDGGLSFTYKAFADAYDIVYSHIFSNGNVLFATLKNELWLGKDSLNTVTQKYLLNPDGSQFEYHTPVNPDYPGIYFKTLNQTRPVWQQGVEVLVAGTYSMYNMPQENGATPVIIWSSIDCGETVNLAYRFGPLWKKDDGTATGGSTGNIVGDPDNPVTAPYHVHWVDYDPWRNVWIASCGETGNMLEGVLDLNTNTWSWERILVNPGKFYRSCGMIFTETHFIILSDYMGDTIYMGVWKVAREDWLDWTKWERIFQNGYPMAPSMIWGDTIIAPHWNYSMDTVISLDSGNTWKVHNDMPLLPPLVSMKTLTIVGYPNLKGEFHVTPYDWYRSTPYGKQSYLIKWLS